LGLPFVGNGAVRVARVSGWDSADPSSLVFADRPGERLRSAECIPAALVTLPDLVPAGWNAILSRSPKLDFARAAALLAPCARAAGRRHATSVVAETAEVEDDVDLGPFTLVAGGARIGSGCILHAGVVVGEGCVVGRDCVLHPRVVLYPGARLGNRVHLHAGVVVGGDGFGYVFDGQRQVKFPQAGTVLIEDDVEVGANSTIDRGSLGITRIGRGTKIDNLVQIAHNVVIGEDVVIAAQTGISGSTVIEDQAVIGGQVGFGDHARVEKGAVIGSKAGVLPGKIVRGNEVYWGIPVRPLREYKRLNAYFGRLPEMKAQLDALRQEMRRLEVQLAVPTEKKED